MMLKKLKLTTAMLILGISAATVQAAEPKANAADLSLKNSASASFKIGVIDIRSIMATSAEVKAIGEKLQKEFKPKEQELIALDKSLKEQVEKLQRNKAVMSESERNKLEKDMAGKQREMQRMQADYREDSTARQQEEMQKFLEKVKKMVNEHAKSESFDMILISDAVPYSSEKADITKKIIEKLNKASS